MLVRLNGRVPDLCELQVRRRARTDSEVQAHPIQDGWGNNKNNNNNNNNNNNTHGCHGFGAGVAGGLAHGRDGADRLPAF